jgi:hypothetical protein
MKEEHGAVKDGIGTSAPSVTGGGQARGRQPWRRQPGEPAGAYAMFRAYLRQEPHRRSIARAAREVGMTPSAGRNASSRYAWQARAMAWDAHLERVETAAVEASRRRQAVLEARVVEKGLRALDREMGKLLALSERDEAPAMTYQQVALVTDTLVKLSRLARGESTEQRTVEVAEAREAIRRRIEAYAAQERARRAQERASQGTP